MTSHAEIKYLPYTAKEMFDLVADISSYPEFLPWCIGSTVIKKRDTNNFDAKLKVGYKAIDEEYISRVSGDYLKEISSNAISGPFKLLESKWKFNKVNDFCEVEFSIRYEFKSFLLGKLMGALFKKASEKMFQAFQDRAKNLYS